MHQSGTDGNDSNQAISGNGETTAKPRKSPIQKLASNFIFHFIAIAILSGVFRYYYSYPTELKKSKESIKPLVQKLFGEYLDAQNTFIKNNYSLIPGNCATAASNKYCDNFRNLYYALDNEGKEIHLVSKQFADAYAGVPQGAPTRGAANSGSNPIDNLVFCESESWKPGDDHFKLAAFLIFRGEPVKIYEFDGGYPELLLPVN